MMNSRKDSPATIADAPLAALKRQQAMALRAAGREAEAVPLLAEALALDSGLADAHFMLAVFARTRPDLKIDMAAVNRGVRDRDALRTAYIEIKKILYERRNYPETLLCQQEICALFPDRIEEKLALVNLLNVTGNRRDALVTMAEALAASPANAAMKAFFANLCGPVVLDRHYPALKQALEICFANIYEASLRKAYSLWINVLLHDPACAGFAQARQASEEGRLDAWLDAAGADNTAFLSARFFHDGMRLLIVGDVSFERLMHGLRRWLCLNFDRLATDGRMAALAPLACALGEYSFYNEYIMATDDAEETAAALAARAATLDGDAACAAYGIASSYRPLHETFPDGCAGATALATGHPHLAALLKAQIDDIRRERALMETIPAFGASDNAVSQNVRAQYEENPYPRWISVNRTPSPVDHLPFDESQRKNPWSMLIAGCGTGRHALGAAAVFPQARITAIDLSRASLAYARRKAEEAGIAHRIEFIHADILAMDQWPGQFDIIESAGVLHHMEDPFRGWQVLNGLLKPGGYFRVGLYSALARRHIVAARDAVAQKGFPPTLDGIRACRAYVLALPPGDPVRATLLASPDFYTTSALRDLVFHVQEHRLTLPQIKDMMQRLHLECLGFTIATADIMNKYDSAFPDDKRRTNIDNWAEFEKNNPDTFGAMYQFWCRKAG